jgi:hypothetical protein
MSAARKVLTLLAWVLAPMPTGLAPPLHPVFKVDTNWPKQLPHGCVFGSNGGVTVGCHNNVGI